MGAGNAINMGFDDIQCLFEESEPDDYKITPSEHAEKYAKAAPELVTVLKTENVKMAAREYESANEDAIEYQNRFKKKTNLANMLVLITAVLSGLVVAVGALEGQFGGVSITKKIVLVLGLSGLITGSFGSMWLFRIRAGRYLDAWMKARAKAETWRLKYFERVTSLRNLPDGNPDPRLLTLMLWYFVRYQFKVQHKYYGDRGKDHNKSAEFTLSIAGCAALLGAVATGLSGILGNINLEFVSLGALAVAGISVSSFASARESMNQDQRNAERYERTQELLTRLEERIPEVRTALETGHGEPLPAFVAAVHDQLSLEHRQWLENAGESSAAVAQLEQSLNDFQAQRPSRPSPQGL